MAISSQEERDDALWEQLTKDLQSADCKYKQLKESPTDGKLRGEFMHRQARLRETVNEIKRSNTNGEEPLLNRFSYVSQSFKEKMVCRINCLLIPLP